MDYVPLTEEQVGTELDGVIGGLLRKQTQLNLQASKKGVSLIEQNVAQVLAKFKAAGAALIHEKFLCVHQPEYLQEKQHLLNQIALEQGTKPEKAKIDEFEFLRVMNEAEL